MTAPRVRRPPKGQRERRLRQNVKPPKSRLNELKRLFENALDRDSFDPGMSLAIDRVVVGLESSAVNNERGGTDDRARVEHHRDDA